MSLITLNDGKALFRPVMVLGRFDGMHAAHRALVSLAVRCAADAGNAPVCLWTFSGDSGLPHGRLTTDTERIGLFREAGADFAVFEDFESFRNMEGESFIKEYLIPAYSPSAIVCGFNFTFGRGASCGSEDLRRFSAEAGVGCFVENEIRVADETVSSTRIRSLIKDGNISLANTLLGHPFSVTSEVTEGKHIGRSIGTRTINQRFPESKIIPRYGVYCCTVEFPDGSVRRGVCNIGVRPTFGTDPGDVTLETHVFGFRRKAYGTTVRTRLYGFLREERKFGSYEELRAQIGHDRSCAIKTLKKYEWQRDAAGNGI